ncbi:MAG: hypothetical protein AVDCRST_MAG87-3044, partial [uncultured Thermomicrobiales bacterium]
FKRFGRLSDLDLPRYQQRNEIASHCRVRLVGQWWQDECRGVVRPESLCLDCREVADPPVPVRRRVPQRLIDGDPVTPDDVADAPGAALPGEGMAHLCPVRIKAVGGHKLVPADDHRRRQAGIRGLGEDPYATVIVLVGAGGRVGVKDRRGRDSGESPTGQLGRDGRTHFTGLGPEQRVHEGVIGVAERRDHVPRAE